LDHSDGHYDHDGNAHHEDHDGQHLVGNGVSVTKEQVDLGLDGQSENSRGGAEVEKLLSNAADKKKRPSR